MFRRLTLVPLLLAAGWPANADFSFAHITDIHVTADPSVYARALRNPPNQQAVSNWSAERQRMIDAVNRAKPDFVVVTGDLTDTGFGIEFAALVEWMNKIEAPVYLVTGNHDVIWSAPLAPGATTRGRALLNYERVFGRSRYSISHDLAYMIFLDSTVADAKAPPAYQAVAREQEKWLTRELAYAERAGYPYVFVFQHYPVQHVEGIRRILKNRSVSAVLFGHIHRYTHGRVEGILQISSSSVKVPVNPPKVVEAAYGLVRVGKTGASYTLYSPDGTQSMAPVEIPPTGSRGWLWSTREQLYPDLPTSTHKTLLSEPR